MASELNRSDELFRMIASSIPDHVIVQDMDLRYTMVVNPQLGLTEQDMLGKTDLDILSREEAEYLMNIKRSVIESSKPYFLEASLQNLRGEEEYFNGSFIPKFDADGKIDGLIGYFRNVTHEKIAELAFKATEERYRLLVENSGLGIGLYDLNGKILYFNQKAIHDLGGKPEDYIGKSMQEVFGQEAADVYIQRMHEVAASDISQEYEDCIEFPSGKFCFLSNYTCLKNPDGTVYGVQVIAHDITLRKIAENKVIDSEEKFRVLSLLSPVGIYLTDTQGNCQYTNRKWLEMAGLSEDEALGTGWSKGLHPDDRDLVFSNWKQMVDSRGKWEMDYRFITPGGKVSWVHGIATPQYDDSGKITSYVGVNIDITEQKLTEIALKESEDKYKKLVELSPDAIVVHSEGKITYVNTAAVESIGGKSAADLIGRNALDFVHPEFRSIALERIRNLLVNKTKAGLTQEKFIKLDGSVIDVETTAIPFIYGGKPSVQLIVRDITERIHIENARLESEIRYQTLFEYNNDSIFLMENDRFVECNPKTLDIFGCTRDQIIGQSPFRFSPEFQPDGSNSRDKALSLIRMALNGTEQFFEWRHCRYDGTLFDAEVRLNIIRIKDKDLLMASVRDITYRKIAGEELKKSEAKYRLLADNILDMVWMMDFDLNLVYASPSVLKKSGFTLQELQQMPIEKKVTPSSFKHLSERFAKEIQELNSDPLNYSPAPIDLEVIHKDGTIYWLEIIYNIIYDDDKTPVSILCVGRDVTGDKLLTGKLRESERQLSFITNHLPVSIAQIDTEERYKFVNIPYAQLLGLQPADIVGMRVSEILGPETYNLARPYIDIALSGQTTVYDLIRNKGAEEKRTLSVVYIPEKNPEGIVTGFIAAITDITGRKQAEDKIKKQLDELQRWQLVTLGREDRNRELKREVNELLVRLGEPIRYPSQEIAVKRDEKDIIQ